MKKKKIILGLALLAGATFALSSCVKSGDSGNTTTVPNQSTSATQPAESASGNNPAQSQSGNDTTPSTSQSNQNTPSQSGNDNTPSQSGQTPSGDDENSESTGFGTGYTAWSELFQGKTRKDSKNRIYLGDTDTEEVSRNGFTFVGKVLLDSNIMNTNGTKIKVNLPSSGSIHMTATWGSSSDSGVIKVYNSADEVVYTSTATYSKDSSAVTLALSNLPQGEYTIDAEKTTSTGTAGLKITTIYYTSEVEYVSVSVNANNDQTIDDLSVRKGGTLSALPTVQKSGFKLVGWYTTSAFTAGTEFTTSTVVNEALIIYAKWEELSAEDMANIVFEANIDGVSYDSISIEKGTTLTLPTTKTVSGYRFDGWYTSNAYSTKFNASTTVSSDTTLYGKYVQQCTITYKDSTGAVITTKDVDYEVAFKDVDKVIAPYVSGKIFEYWVKEGTDVKFTETDDITTNITLVAKYRDQTAADVTINYTAQEGLYEAAYVTFDKYEAAESYAIYKVQSNGTQTKLSQKDYYLSETSNSARIDIFGLPAGDYTFMVAPVVGGEDIVGLGKNTNTIKVEAYDRSGYAHFNYTNGVGAYKDDGSLKDNAIVLYVTDENKNTVELTYGNTTVVGIGNILNSVGQACGDAGHETECKKVSDGKTTYGKGNTNQGILLTLAENNIPLVVRFIGCVSDSGLYQPGTFAASSASKIQGLTAYNSADYGGTTGDNGHMARMKSAKNITFEGVGDNAAIDGWGFHLICETAYPDYAKNFEVRNLTFMNTPEDAIGMEGQETESTLTITASVERCWVHHNTFLCPKISSPAESDKSEGDGSCDFKRGRFFTCSYNYFEECHKTNLVGSSKTSVQYNMSYHHNIWYNCAARQPLARRGNIHFYNNLIIGTTDTVSSLRADSLMFAEGNYYMGCSRPVEYKAEGSTGLCKSYNNNLVGCFNNYDAFETTDREATLSSPCKDNATNISYANFDTNPEIFYYDSVNKKSDCYLTDPNQARLDCIAMSGSRYRTALDLCKLKTTPNVTSVASSATVSGATSLTIAKGKGVLKVFTVTSPVTISISATSTAGFDTGYLLKMDGSLVLKLSSSAKTAVLTNGEYVIASSISFTGANGKNDKETTVTACSFEPFDSEELNQQMIASYNSAVAAIPATVEYNDASYNAIKNAMDVYNSLGDLKSRITDYDSVVLAAYNTYKTKGQDAVVALINAIGTVSASSGQAITAARAEYNKLTSRCTDATVSNYSTLQSAEAAFESFAVDACKAAIDAIGTVTLDSKDAIEYAEDLYASLEASQKSQVNNYSTLTAARTAYDSLKKVADANSLVAQANSLTTYAEAYTAYNALTSAEKAQVTGYSDMVVAYTIALISDIGTVNNTSGAKITLARSVYDSLSSTEKSSVTNYSTLTDAETAYAAIGANVIKWSADGKYTSDQISSSGNKNDKTATFDGVEFSYGLKMESSNGIITITITKDMKLTVYQTGGSKLLIDSTKVAVGSLVEYNLTAGTHTIKKGDGSAIVYLIILE